MSEPKLHLILSTVKSIKAKLDQEESGEQERIEREKVLTEKVKQVVEIVDNMASKEALLKMVKEAILGSESESVEEFESVEESESESVEESESIEELLDSIINRDYSDITVEDIKQAIDDALCSDALFGKLTIEAINSKLDDTFETLVDCIKESECNCECKRVKLS